MKRIAGFLIFFLLGCEGNPSDLTPDADADASNGVDSDSASDDLVSDDLISEDSISESDSDFGCDPALLGLPCEVGVGECRRSGVTICLSPGSVGCSATPGTPTAEICDDLDNDCDGEADEDLVGCCTVGEHAPCGTDVGECEFGEKECLPGQVWSECRGGQGPVAESCDGRDNDCDGLTDEDWDLASDVNNCGSCGNVCDLPNAMEGCSGGSCVVLDCEGFNTWTQYFNIDGNNSNGCEYACRCTLLTIGHEFMADGGTDNDCDGRVDEDSANYIVLYLGLYDEFDYAPGCDVIGDGMAVDFAGRSGDVGSVVDSRRKPLCTDGILTHRKCYSPDPRTQDYGFLFDGDDYIYFSDSTDLDSIGLAFTFFIWVKPQTLEDGDYVIWREPSDQFSLKMRNVGGHFKWQFCLSATACGNTTSDIALDTWTLLTFTYSASTVRIYVNAVEEASFTGSFTPGGEMRMGGDGSSHYYHGGTDEIALYSTALPVSDISWYYEFAHPRP